MKAIGPVVVFFVLLFGLCSAGRGGGRNPNQKSKKFTKVDCTSSGKSAKVSICQLKPYSRNYTVLNAGFDVVKKLEKLRVNYDVYFKYFSNWRQIMKIPTLDGCSVLNYSLRFKRVETIAATILKGVEGGAPQCPWNVGFKFRMFNYTDVEEISNFQVFPSGEYKQVLKMFNDDDDLIYEISLQSTFRDGGKYEF